MKWRSEGLPSWGELCCSLDGLKCTHDYNEWDDNLEEQRTTHLNEELQRKIQFIENIYHKLWSSSDTWMRNVENVCFKRSLKIRLKSSWNILKYFADRCLNRLWLVTSCKTTFLFWEHINWAEKTKQNPVPSTSSGLPWWRGWRQWGNNKQTLGQN